MPYMKRAVAGTVMTDLGYSITFEADTPTYVHDIEAVITKCRAAGAVDAEDEPAAVEAPAKTAKAK